MVAIGTVVPVPRKNIFFAEPPLVFDHKAWVVLLRVKGLGLERSGEERHVLVMPLPDLLRLQLSNQHAQAATALARFEIPWMPTDPDPSMNVVSRPHWGRALGQPPKIAHIIHSIR